MAHSPGRRRVIHDLAKPLPQLISMILPLSTGSSRLLMMIFATTIDQAGSGDPPGVSEQLRKGGTAQAVYELIFGLDYLTATFSLESDGRPLSQLSPGQRGTLLLLFYLLVDKSHRPIVLDQPEENLDNQTVHELLVPAIAEARKWRQVIAVTHNPNLAVVGDADQVIVAEMTGGQFRYFSGAIEDPRINGRIVEILEGTWPAFQNRSDKYTPTSVADQTSRSTSP